MLIAWLKKFSLLDYPWKVSCIIFTPSCNFRCSFCHNPELVLWDLLKQTYKDLIKQKEFFKFLEKRKNLLDWVSICWGEPTLQEWLIDFCKKVKKMWFFIKLDTNWTNPKIIKKLLNEKLVDYIAMDYKHNLSKIDKLIKIKINKQDFLKSVDLLLNSNIDYEFRTTLIKWIHKREDIEDITKSIKWARSYFLQKFERKNILDSDFIWGSFSVKEIQEFDKIARKYIKKVWIRD